MFYSDYVQVLIRMAHIEIATFSHAYIEHINGKYSRTVDYSTITWC